MDNIINFITSYHQIIIGVLLIVLSIVSMLVKRKPKTLDDFISFVQEALNAVPDWMIKVERPGDGAQKLMEVQNLAYRYVKFRLGRKLTDQEIAYLEREVEKQVGSVMSAPSIAGKEQLDE